MTLCFQKYTR